MCNHIVIKDVEDVEDVMRGGSFGRMEGKRYGEREGERCKRDASPQRGYKAIEEQSKPLIMIHSKSVHLHPSIA